MASTTAHATNVLGHQAFVREADNWLGKRANPNEFERTQRLLSSVKQQGPADEAELDASAADQPQARKSGMATPPIPKLGGSGWTYTATTATRRKPPAVAQHLTGGLDGSSGSSTPRQHEAAEDVQGAGASGAAAAGSKSSRPQSAPAVHSDRELQRLLASAAAMRQQTGSAGEQRPGTARGSSSSSGRVASMLRGPNAKGMMGEVPNIDGTSPDITTYQASFHLGQMYPELFNAAVEGTRAVAAPNITFTSDWGDALKQANDQEWRDRHFKSTYTAANEDVVKEATHFDVAKEQMFHKWVAKQQWYFRDLLKEKKVKTMEELWSMSSTEERREMLATMRQLHAVLRPEMMKSHSQAEHWPMSRTEDPELEAMMREQTRLRTMGHPPPRIDMATVPQITLGSTAAEALAAAVAATMAKKQQQDQQQQQPRNAAAKVDLVFTAPGQQQQQGATAGLPRRPSTASGGVRDSASHPLSSLVMQHQQQAERCGSAGAGGRPGSSSGQQRQRPATTGSMGVRRGPKPDKVERDTYRSNVPLKWALHTSNQGPSTSYMQAFGSNPAAHAALERVAPARSREVTVPYGAVNPHTALTPPRPAYAVPEHFTQVATFPMPSAPEGLASLTAAARAAAVDSMVQSGRGGYALQKSTLPMGPRGMQLVTPKDWRTEYDATYVGRKADPAATYASAQVLKRALNGPTASGLKLTATLPEYRAQQQQAQMQEAAPSS